MPERSAEHIETLRSEVLVAFKRLGTNRVHFALVMPETMHAATHFGASCTVIASPVAAWCGRTLRGDIIEIPRDKLDGWHRNGHVCRECRLIAHSALREVAGV